MNGEEVEERNKNRNLQATLETGQKGIGVVKSTGIIMEERVERSKQNETEINIKPELKYIPMSIPSSSGSVYILLIYCLSVYLAIYPSIYQCIYPSSISLLSISLSIICLHISHLSIYLSIHIYVESKVKSVPTCHNCLPKRLKYLNKKKMHFKI